MKELPIINSRVQLKSKRVLLRLDWNIPVQGMPSKEDLAKIDASVATVKYLQKHGAIVIILTHLGRPKKRDKALSTVRLLPIAEAYLDAEVMFCGEDITKQEGLKELVHTFEFAKPGDLFLMENVRFYAGEEQNDIALSQAYASLADYFVNDAFASSHRAHVSVVGIARYLPHFAGQELEKEIEAANKLIEKPKKPFIAVIGGVKLSTKMPVINSLLKIADKVLIGGAMAHPFFVAKRLKIGKSYTEKEGVKLAKALLKNKKIVLPTDVIVSKKIDAHAKPHVVSVNEIKANETIGDIGTTTMREWSSIIKGAQTILWNGPLGVAEISAFSHGSLVIARAIAARSNGRAYGLVGGGDTVPVALQTGMSEWFDHVSMGGGALLEFIEKKGRLPGIEALKRPASHVPIVLRQKIKIKSKKIVQRVKKIVHKKGSLKKRK